MRIGKAKKEAAEVISKYNMEDYIPARPLDMNPVRESDTNCEGIDPDCYSNPML